MILFRKKEAYHSYCAAKGRPRSNDEGGENLSGQSVWQDRQLFACSSDMPDCSLFAVRGMSTARVMLDASELVYSYG